MKKHQIEYKHVFGQCAKLGFVFTGPGDNMP